MFLYLIVIVAIIAVFHGIYKKIPLLKNNLSEDLMVFTSISIFIVSTVLPLLFFNFPKWISLVATVILSCGLMYLSEKLNTKVKERGGLKSVLKKAGVIRDDETKSTKKKELAKVNDKTSNVEIVETELTQLDDSTNDSTKVEELEFKDESDIDSNSESAVSIDILEEDSASATVNESIDSEVEVAADIAADVVAEGEAENELETEVEVAAEGEIETEVEVEVEAEVETEVEVGIKADVEAEVETEVEVGIEADVEAEVEASVEDILLNETSTNQEISIEPDTEIIEEDLLAEHEISAETLSSQQVLMSQDDYDLDHYHSEEKFLNTEDISEDVETESLVKKVSTLRESKNFDEAMEICEKIMSEDVDMDITFETILETCLIYREIGQNELAIHILSGYINEYGDIMSKDIRDKIESNFGTEVFK